MKKDSKKPKKAAAKKPEVKLETIPERHEFTDAEKIELGAKIAALTQEKVRTEEEKKVVVAQWATRIKAIQTDIATTSSQISTGFEMRPTECEVHYDWKKGKKTYLRKSDGKQIREQSITDPERQQKLFEEEKEKKDSALKPGENIVSVEAALKQAEQAPEASDE